MEPLLIDRLVMENDAGPVRVTAAFSNITVIGPSNYTITKVRYEFTFILMTREVKGFPELGILTA